MVRAASALIMVGRMVILEKFRDKVLSITLL